MIQLAKKPNGVGPTATNLRRNRIHMGQAINAQDPDGLDGNHENCS
jgi:hypothetical protein